MHHEVTPSFPSNPPSSKVAVPDAVESVPPKIGRSGCSRRGTWPERLSMARVKPGVWFRITEPLTKASASQMASDLRNSYRRRLESLLMSGVVVVDERWEAEYGNDPTNLDPEHFYVWFRSITPTPSTILAEGVTRLGGMRRSRCSARHRQCLNVHCARHSGYCPRPHSALHRVCRR
jgi:hypothetical protein